MYGSAWIYEKSILARVIGEGDAARRGERVVAVVYVGDNNEERDRALADLVAAA